MADIATRTKAGFFKLGGSYFAVDQVYLRQVVSVTKVTPVPRSHASLLGLFAFRGTILPLIDLGALLGFTFKNRLLDLAIVTEYKEQSFAISLDEMLGFFSYQEMLDADQPHPLQSFGKPLSDTHQTLLLDIPRVVEHMDRYLVVM